MVDNKVVEIMWLENKFRKTSHDWATKLVAAGAGSEDLNIGSDCNIKYGKKKCTVWDCYGSLQMRKKLQQVCIQILSLQF